MPTVRGSEGAPTYLSVDPSDGEDALTYLSVDPSEDGRSVDAAKRRSW